MLALLASADVGVEATRNLAGARPGDDAITVHVAVCETEVVVDHVHVKEVYTVRAARVGGPHADPITVGRIDNVHPVDRDGCRTKVVVGTHPGVLRVANVDATTPLSP